jgi:CRISPR-associated endonuclease/helicase Cas3
MIYVKEETANTYDVPFVGTLKPYAHQIVQQQLIREVIDQNKKVIIWNEAMTGAGKTLANYSSLLYDPHIKALGIYPVNELIKDQYRSVQKNLPLKDWEDIGIWTADELKKRREPGQTTIEQLAESMNPAFRLILSNPDYLMLISQERFHSYKKGEQPALFYQLLEFQLQIFDEFHLYHVAQINFLLQWMALLISVAPYKPFAFLLSSATPRNEFFALARNLGIEIWRVQDKVKEWLDATKPPVFSKRTYLEPLKLQVKSSNLRQWQTAEKILENWRDVEEYLFQYPKAKGLVILDSIHEAQMLASQLREKGYEVGEVHGLSDRQKSEIELGKQITVATATVEVGVDFQGDMHKDFLIFEARSAGSFMQRLGRIGRGSCSKPSPPLHVWAYVPPYVAERINNQSPAQVTRSELKDFIMQSYQYYQDFIPYIHKVGGMNLVHHYHLIAKHQLEKKENPILANIKQSIELLYGEGFESQRTRYEQLKQEKILEPVISFRGQNTLESHLFRLKSWRKESEHHETFYPDVWFWDESIPEAPLRKYDFWFVLRRRMVRFITKEEMIAKVNERFRGAEREEHLAALQNDYVLGYAVAMGIREKPARLHWKLRSSVSKHKGQVVRIDRLSLEAPEDPWLNQELKQLFHSAEKKSWVAYMMNHSIWELSDLLRLPPMFRIYPAKKQGADWSIAFNSEAFQLWSIMERVRSEVL